MMKQLMPRPIEEAEKDGRDYILWDEANRGWFIGYYHSVFENWVSYEYTNDYHKFTHFIPYLSPEEWQNILTESNTT